MKLHYVEYGGEETPLVILHGLLGSERNWHSVAKRLAPHFHLIIPDLRNHGVSGHEEDHSISSMCDDVEELVDDLDLEPFFLLGHSMGGHVAMHYAYRHPGRLKALVVEDIAPRSYHTGLVDILEAMAAVDLSQYREKRLVELALRSGIPDSAIRHFVLTNLVRDNDRLYWRVNVQALLDFARNEVSRFQANPGDLYDGPTLFLGGMNSMYRLDHDEDVIRQHFPSAEIRMVPDAGHWIHHEAPDAFCDVVTRFLQRQV